MELVQRIDRALAERRGSRRRLPVRGRRRAPAGAGKGSAGLHPPVRLSGLRAGIRDYRRLATGATRHGVGAGGSGMPRSGYSEAHQVLEEVPADPASEPRRALLLISGFVANQAPSRCPVEKKTTDCRRPSEPRPCWRRRASAAQRCGALVDNDPQAACATAGQPPAAEQLAVTAYFQHGRRQRAAGGHSRRDAGCRQCWWMTPTVLAWSVT